MPRSRFGSRTRTAPRRAAATAEPPVELVVDGVAVRLVRKRIKNLNLRVKAPDGQVEASAPLHATDADVARFVREKRAWIEARRADVAASPSAAAAAASSAEKAAWRADVEARVPALIAQWEPVIGVRAGKVAYRDMTSRWGSCNPQTGRICINIRLALYPPECLEYVVVHELCHLLERGHGPRFKALLDRHLPTWKSRRALLR